MADERAHINTTRMATLRKRIIELEDELMVAHRRVVDLELENDRLHERVSSLTRCCQSMEDQRRSEWVIRNLAGDDEEKAFARAEMQHEQLMAARFQATLGEDGLEEDE